MNLITRIISCASLTTASLILNTLVSAPDKNMLGEQIAEYKGKIIGQRVLDVEGPTMETSVSASGKIKGTEVNVNITYIARPTSPGVLHGEGKGVIMAGASEMVTETGTGTGVFTSSRVKWRGAQFYRTSSTGRLASLNNVVGVFEAEVDTEGNFSLKTWEGFLSFPILLRRRFNQSRTLPGI